MGIYRNHFRINKRNGNIFKFLKKSVDSSAFQQLDKIIVAYIKMFKKW